MRYFFLSYARGDDDEYVQRFYRDLCREIRVREGIRPGEPVGFIDVDSIRLGASWPTELVGAISECAVFLPLYSPGYFLSEYCGKEWAAFNHRTRLHLLRNGVPAENVLPVVWFTPTSVPPVAQTIHYNTMTLGPAYAEWGLRQLIRLRRFEDDYQETVTALAAQIVAIAQRHHLPPIPLDLTFEELTSPFLPAAHPGALSQEEPQPLAQEAPDPPQPTGEAEPGGNGTTRASGHVSFVIASAGSEELRSVRSTLDAYGPSARHWMPYRPSMPRPLGNFACEVAGRHHLGSELAELDSLDAQIAQALRDNSIVVLLVDPWIARIAGYNARLEAYDRRNEPTVPVLIALNEQDDETRHHRAALDEAVQQAFPNNMLRQDVIFRPAVGSAEQFAEDLQFVLKEDINRLLRRGVVRRRPAIEVAPARPVLEGPSAP